MARFVYLNVNPDQTKRNDCVTRAISLATKLPYAEVRKKLFHTAQLLDCEKLCMTCYSFLIQEVLGGMPRNCENMTVEEFADQYPYGTFLVRIDYHLTCIVNNTIYDIWDCKKRLCTAAWEVR